MNKARSPKSNATGRRQIGQKVPNGEFWECEIYIILVAGETVCLRPEKRRKKRAACKKNWKSNADGAHILYDNVLQHRHTMARKRPVGRENATKAHHCQAEIMLASEYILMWHGRSDLRRRSTSFSVAIFIVQLSFILLSSCHQCHSSTSVSLFHAQRSLVTWCPVRSLIGTLLRFWATRSANGIMCDGFNKLPLRMHCDPDHHSIEYAGIHRLESVADSRRSAVELF